MQRSIFIVLLLYCFLYGILFREVGGIPYGLFVEGLIIITIIAVIIITPKFDWKIINNDLFFCVLIWLVVSILEVINPAASVLGWIAELRSIALYPFVMVWLGFLIFKTQKDLDLFLMIIIGLSVLAALNGIKQLFFGLTKGEAAFLEANASTHLLWGRLRVFSFYTDAGQFGASQAQVGLIALILAFGKMSGLKRILMLACAGLCIYGMLISGTRGALFALIAGGIVAIILSKNITTIVLGSLLAISFLGILKFTHIGDQNYQIYRLRTALNPEDASLNVRLINQQNLSAFMETMPFGGGLGSLGYNGLLYNSGTYLSTVPPDSLFVKIWAMYGVVGLTIWFSIMMFILGKCCGITWSIQDRELRIKLIALTAGFAGILFCSYGNEVLNTMPTAIVVYLSWVFIYLGPKLEAQKKNIIRIKNPSLN
ncbi:O-antigen ligase domain-containing protein [Pedobacter frigidisoli]|uniref:O-antigen ligase domain-containing protein n=1 Tax=Pedobacter frigidisoli TaxID=2530455 RepID=A0A4R0NMA9_9SPHI|nr:O-antigen ligase family protein [Pedobacter frigidisoli]TCD01992.1 O-antigen ligase domain-containing protein [Pedobacter frigidisoli]